MKDIRILFAVALATMSFSVTACSDDDGGDKGNPATQKECTADKDCKDASKPVCSKEGKCVAKSSSDTNTGTGTGTGSGTGTGTGSEVGAKCDAETFAETCNGNKLVYCNKGEVAEFDCVEGGYICDTTPDGKNASCYPSKGDECKENATDRFCESVITQEVEFPVKCLKFKSGQLRWVDATTKESDYKVCDSTTETCDPDGKKCIAAYANPGKTCDEKSYKESCKDGKLLACDGDEYTFDCSKLNLECASIAKDGYALCIEPDRKCTGNETKNVCDYDDYGDPFQAHLTCIDFDGGKKYLDTATDNDFNYCANDCNEAGTACDAQGVEDGMEE